MEGKENNEKLEELSVIEQTATPTVQNKNMIGDNSKQEDLLKEILKSINNVEVKMKKIELMLKEQKPSKNWIG